MSISPLLKLPNELLVQIIACMIPTDCTEAATRYFQNPYDSRRGGPIMRTYREHKAVVEALALFRANHSFGLANRRIHTISRHVFFQGTTFTPYPQRCRITSRLSYVPLVILPDSNAVVLLDSLVLPQDQINRIHRLELTADSLYGLTTVLLGRSLTLETCQDPRVVARVLTAERARFGPLVSVEHISIHSVSREAMGFSNNAVGNFPYEYACSNGGPVFLPSPFETKRLWLNLIYMMPRLKADIRLTRTLIPDNLDSCVYARETVRRLHSALALEDTGAVKIWVILLFCDPYLPLAMARPFLQMHVPVKCLNKVFEWWDRNVIEQIKGMVEARNKAVLEASED